MDHQAVKGLRSVVSLAVFSSLVLLSAEAQSQTGTLLREFPAAGAVGNGRGMAFDGTNLYYTIFTAPPNTNVYKVSASPTGPLLATIPVNQELGPIAGGPLAWDGSALWTMNYALNSFTLYRVNPATGTILSSCNIQTANPEHPAVTSTPNIGRFPNGLDWSGSTLWVSSDNSSPPNWVVEVDTNCNILKAFNPPQTQGQPGLPGAGTNFGTSGVAFDGVGLWHSNAHGVQFKTNLTGTAAGVSFTNDRQLMDLAYDSVTFAPKCALWGNEATFNPSNRITAYEVPCGLSVTAVQPSELFQFEAGLFTITGTGFQQGATVNFGSGVQVESVTFVNDTTLEASLVGLPSTVHPMSDSTELKNATVTNPNGSSTQLASALTLVKDSDGDGVPNGFNDVVDNCPFVVNPTQNPEACSDELPLTEAEVTLAQTVSNTDPVQNEAVMIDVTATFGSQATGGAYAFFPLALWNVFFKVLDVTGCEIECVPPALEPRIFEVGISLDDVLVHDGAETTTIETKLLVNLADQYTLMPGRTYRVETYIESRVKGEAVATGEVPAHCTTLDNCPPILSYRVELDPQEVSVVTVADGEVPNVDGKVVVEPSFWDPAWLTTPDKGTIDIFYGNLQQPFNVANVQVSSVRLFGSLQPLSSSLISNKTGFSGQVLRFSFDKTAAIAALRAWVGHVLSELNPEQVLLTGRLTSNGQAGPVIGVFSDSATVQILPAGDIDALIAKVQGNLSISNSLKNSLLAKLRDARTAIHNGQLTRACGKLNDFISEVQAQRGKGIPIADADDWIAHATRIRGVLRC